MRIAVGALGAWRFPAGSYLYVGSAWGPGGLQARVGRHLDGSPVRRWHIDYLRQHAHPTGVWLAPCAHLECMWAQWLAENALAEIIVPRFGASDCACRAHLFRLAHGALPALILPGGPRYVRLDAQVKS